MVKVFRCQGKGIPLTSLRHIELLLEEDIILIRRIKKGWNKVSIMTLISRYLHVRPYSCMRLVHSCDRQSKPEKYIYIINFVKSSSRETNAMYSTFYMYHIRSSMVGFTSTKIGHSFHLSFVVTYIQLSMTVQIIFDALIK